MIGIGRRKKAMFGKPMAQPAIGGGYRQGTAGYGQGFAPVEQERPGLGTRLLGQGWEDKAFALGGLLAGDGGRGVAQYHALRNAEAQAEQQAAAAQAADMRERSLDYTDWQRKQEWQRANPMPQAPDAFERALTGAGIDPASEQAQAMYRARVESMASDPDDEFVIVPIPGRGTYAGPKSGLPGVFQQPQGSAELPVGYKVRGGPASAPGGFRG